MSSRPTIWCPCCKEDQTCPAGPMYLSCGDGPSSRIAVPEGGDEETDPRGFFRKRRCSQCEQEWSTIEVPHRYLSGLLAQRRRVVEFLNEFDLQSRAWKKYYDSGPKEGNAAWKEQEFEDEDIDRLLAELDEMLGVDSAAGVDPLAGEPT